jgi:hypothetical protein
VTRADAAGQATVADEPRSRADHFFANALEAGEGHRGWFVGHFMGRPEHPLWSRDVELKWGVHRRGDRRPEVAPGDGATALSVLVSGRFVLEFAERERVLARPGDFVLWPPGVAHGWRAEEDSVVLTVRWPSRPSPGPG